MRAIVLFARSPRREAIAKRLRSPNATRVFRDVVAAWTSAAASCDAQVLVACEPDDRAAFNALAWMEQRGASFGERVACAAEDAFARGFGQVIVAAIDAPPRDLRAAFASLGRGVAVVSPARDGGVNYIGLTAPERALLGTFAQRDRTLLARCKRYFGELCIVGGAVDVDSESALHAARYDPAWRGFFAPRTVLRDTQSRRPRISVGRVHESRPPPSISECSFTNC